MDRPNERSLHQRPTPRIGGLAVVPAVILTSLVLGSANSESVLLLGLACGLFVLSIVDDWRNLPAGIRFGSHLLAAVLLVLGMNGGWPVALAGIVAITWMTNLYNFMDGANGLAGGMSLIGFAVLGLASGEPTVASAVVGAAAGFLLFNFDPARVFLGDAGSVPVGFIAAGISYAGVVDGRWPLWFPLLVFAPFVVDASVTLVKRMWQGERFWSAHRKHYYQRLIRMGWSHRRLALAEYALMALSGALGLGLLDAQERMQWIGVIVCLLAYVGLMVWIDRRWKAVGEPA